MELKNGADGGPELAAFAAVKGPDNEFLGVVANFILLSELEHVFTGKIARELGAATTGPGPRKTLEAYLVNRDGLMLTDSRFIENAPLRQKVSSDPVKACLDQGREMTGFYADYRGVKVAGASMCMPAFGWTLLVEIDAEEALYPVTAMGRDALVGAAAVAILICVLGHLDIVVNGKAGTAMAAFGAQLNEVDLAAVITYERNAWGNNMGDMLQPIDVAKFKKAK